ncbi:MAG TPA: PqiC family protein [Paraburkholderia sp.]
MRQAVRESGPRTARIMMVLACTAVSVATIAGCGHSMPIRYVTLNATPADAPLATTRMQPVQLTAVHIPAELDRPEVVTQISPNRLKIDDSNRWSAPLAQMMRRALAQDLAARLPAGSFVFPDAPAPPGTRTLVVTVLDSQADANGTLSVQVAWTLLSGQPASATLSQQAVLHAQFAGHDADAQAAALSRILGELSDRIAASLAGGGGGVVGVK